MPLPRSAARFNRRVTNHLFAPLAGRVPPWILLEHTGRHSGRTYRTVVWAFPVHGDLVVALTYGPAADWVRNVKATARVTVELGDETRVGAAHVLEPGTADDALARALLLAKYATREDDLAEWGRTALPVAIEFPAEAA